MKRKFANQVVELKNLEKLCGKIQNFLSEQDINLRELAGCVEEFNQKINWLQSHEINYGLVEPMELNAGQRLLLHDFLEEYFFKSSVDEGSVISTSQIGTPNFPIDFDLKVVAKDNPHFIELKPVATCSA